MTMDASVRTFPHEVTRLVVDVGQPYDDFRQRYEEAVPALDKRQLDALIDRAASWEDVVAQATADAPHGFLIYWRSDTTPLMKLAGNRWRCVEYLMGNHAIAERMFRHDPSVMLYAPLRTAIYVAGEGHTYFAVDQPSTCFSSFGNAAIAAVGVELDGKLAALLAVLGAAVPAELTKQ
jgi:hypothetical protein